MKDDLIKAISSIFLNNDSSNWLSTYEQNKINGVSDSIPDLSAAAEVQADEFYGETYSCYMTAPKGKPVGSHTPIGTCLTETAPKYTVDADDKVMRRDTGIVQGWAAVGKQYRSGLDQYTIGRIGEVAGNTTIDGWQAAFEALSHEYPIVVADRVMQAGAYFLASMNSPICSNCTSPESRFVGTVVDMIRPYDDGKKGLSGMPRDTQVPTGELTYRSVVDQLALLRSSAPVAPAAETGTLAVASVATSNNVIELQAAADFQAQVIEASKKLPVFVYAYSGIDNSAALRAMIEARSGKVRLVIVDLAKYPGVVTAGITQYTNGTPTTISASNDRMLEAYVKAAKN